MEASLSIRFSRQQYWSALPFLLLGVLPDPELTSASPALAGGLFTTRAAWEAPLNCEQLIIMLINDDEAFTVAQLVKDLPAVQETWV